MNRFQEIIFSLKKDMKDMSFSEILRTARHRLGLKQYWVAEHLGITLNRIHNLEIGYFRNIPSALEIKLLCEFYQLSQDEMIEKAQVHVAQHDKKKKVKEAAYG